MCYDAEEPGLGVSTETCEPKDNVMIRFALSGRNAGAAFFALAVGTACLDGHQDVPSTQKADLASATETGRIDPARRAIATVDRFSIDAEDLRRAAVRLINDDRSLAELSETERQQVLDVLIDVRLLALEAERRGLDRRADVREAVAAAERAVINPLVYQREVDARLNITDAEVREQYDLWGSGEVIEPAHILVRDRVTADAVLAALAEGADFADLARQHSLHAGSAARDGSMGFLRKYLIPDPLRERIWDLPAGTLYPTPVRTRMGYHVVKVRQRGQLSLEQQEHAIRSFLTRRGRAILRRDLMERLQQQFDYAWHTEAAVQLARQQARTPEQAVLASWRGGRLTVGEYRRRARGPGAVTADTSRIRKAAEKLVAEELVLLEGRNQGLDGEPGVRRQVEAAYLGALSQAFSSALKESSAPSAEQVHTFFDIYREKYRGPDRMTIREIHVAERSTADSLYSLLLDGADMAALARSHTLRTESRKSGGLREDMDRYGSDDATVYRHALSGDGLLEPVALPTGGYSVIRVLERKPGRMLELAEVEAAVRTDLQAMVMDSLIAELRDQYSEQVTVDPYRLEQLF